MRWILALILTCTACQDRTDIEPEDTSEMGGGRSDLFVPLGKGIRTDIAADLLPLGFDLEVENMQFDLTGSMVKRFGTVTQSLTVQPGASSLPQPWQLTTHKGARVSLSQPGPSPVATYSPTQVAWNLATSDRRGPITAAINRLTNQGQDPRTAVGAGYIFIASASPNIQGVYNLDVIDSVTNHRVTGFSFTPAGIAVAYDVVFCNGLAVFVTNEFGVGIVFRTLTPSSMSISTTTFAAAPGTAALDVMIKNATTISVVYSDVTIHAAAVDFVPSTLATTGWSPRDATAATILMDNFCAWVLDLGASGKQALVTSSSTQGIRVQWDIPAAGATRQAATTYNADPATTGPLVKIAAHTIDSSSTGSFQVVYTTAGSIQTNNLTHMAIRTGGVLTTGFVLYRSVTITSKAWTVNGDFFATFSYVPQVAGIDTGNTYVLRLPVQTTQPALAAPQAQYAIGVTRGTQGFFSVGNLPTVNVIVTGAKFLYSLGFIQNFDGQGATGVSVSSLGMETVTISHLQSASDTSTGLPIEALDSTLVPGGTVGMFDGAVYGEMGFPYSPDVATLTPAGGGSMTANATYWYVFTYVRQDAQGRVWISGTSTPLPVAMGANNSVNGLVPTLRVTGYSNVRIEVYRGGANSEALFQKVTEIANSLTSDTVSFSDTTDDITLAIGKELYTGENGNAILNNDTIPGASFLFTYGNRVFFLSADEPTELWFSNVISPGNGVRFNSQNIVRIADAHGAAIAAASMEDKVVVVKGDAVYTFNGDGPDDAGNGSFPTPVIVALGIGTANPRSVVSFKDGVFFKSTANRPGMQMIDRGLSIASASDGSPFGAAVEKYASETIMSAILVPEQSQIRFYCLSGRVLVYDLVSKMWATFLLTLSGDHVVSAVATNGAALIATDSPHIILEDISGATYTDAGQTYGVRVASPWVQVDSIKGFERVIQLIGVGRTIGDHTLDVQMFKDFDDTAIVNEKTWAMTVANFPLWNWEWNRPRVARMSAEKLVLLETSTGAGFRVEGVSETLGLRSGLARQPTSTRGP